jgi:hypothetical protein
VTTGESSLLDVFFFEEMRERSSNHEMRMVAMQYLKRVEMAVVYQAPAILATHLVALPVGPFFGGL